ncbi:MAG: malto-oligosyltrehalose synthase, partial [Gemmatimonadetes bacterium]|nr:malto-oligosyltrehalose synthase [Gemmatimonadota bacterium]
MPWPLTATYRLQLHQDFGFEEAHEILPYLERLGISHVYTSPVLAARPGSTHGYDVVDPGHVNPEFGGDEGRRAFVEALEHHGLGHVLDIVPNHMGIGQANRYWEDVLAKGRQSPYAQWFDVDWSGGIREAADRPRAQVILPVLGDELETVLGRGELALVLEDGGSRLQYCDRSFPIAPESTANLPSSGLDAWSDGLEGHERLRQLIAQQHYRLAFWRRGAREINYRRFFDVADLAALRMERPEVFEAVHARVLEWVADGSVDGLRVDHIDGLRDPLAYLIRLREEVNSRLDLPRTTHHAPRTFPVFVEKILSPEEQLREDWPVDGTTGYDFLNDLEALFVDPEGFEKIRSQYLRFCRIPGHERGFASVAYGGKLKILRGSLRADVRRLARLLFPIARAALPDSRITRASIARALEKLLAYFPVYRTYVDGRPGPVHSDDRRWINRALERALEDPLVDRPLAELVARVLTKEAWDELPRRQRTRRLEFIQRFQQTTGPAAAKGVEDTALYQWVPLASLNEVGGDPGRSLGDAVQRLHRANCERAAKWPQALICTSTHDTKRSADVRARLDVLSEIPDQWLAAVRRWRRINRPLRGRAGRRIVPDPNTEYLLYQTLVGIWPVGK